MMRQRRAESVYFSQNNTLFRTTGLYHQITTQRGINMKKFVAEPTGRKI